MNSPDACPACGSKRSARVLGGLCQHCLVRNLVPAPAAPLPAHSDGPSDPFDERVGRMVGRYRVVRRLGEGGAGVVYAAEQETPVRRRVALKCIKPGMDTRSVLIRFDAERQALALMDHPCIAAVFDAGSTTSGHPYFVMELVEGVRITEFCDQRQLPIAERLQLFVQVCQAVQHAHQKGIIHRDLKPSNILVAPERDAATPACPKIIDFGIAKATGAQLTEATLLTEQGQLVGTPAYMSPEQVSVDSVDIDTRSDIYSLGVLLYELLTGHLPTPPDALAKGGVEGLRQAILGEDPPCPSVRLRRLPKASLEAVAGARFTESVALTGQLTGDLDWIAMRCLEKDRGRRYETAQALAEELGRHLADEPVLAGPPSTTYVFRKFARRHRTALLLASTAIVVLVAATAISLRLAFRAWDAESLAARRLAETEKSRDESLSARKDAETFARYLINVFRSPDPSREGRTITVAESLGRAATQIESDLRNEPLHQAKLQAALGETYQGLGMYPEAVAILESSRALLVSALGPENQETRNVERLLAGALDKSGRHDRAIAILKEGLDQPSQATGADRIAHLHSLRVLAKTYRNSGNLGTSVTKYREALSISRELLGPDHPDTLSVLSELAGSPGVGLDERFSLYEELNTRAQRSRGGDDRLALHAELGLATASWGTRLTREAAELFRDLLSRAENQWGCQDPASIKIRKRFTAFCLAEYCLEDLDGLFSVDLERARSAVRPDPAAIESSLLNLAWLRRMQGRFPESEALCREAQTSLERTPSEGRGLTVLTATLFLGTVYADWAWAERTNNPSRGLALAHLATGLLRTNLETAALDARVTRKRLATLQFQLGGAITVAAILDPHLTPALRAEALADAERLIRDGAEVLHPIRKEQRSNYRECLQRGIRLFESRGETNAATECRNRLTQLTSEPNDYEEFE